MRSLLSLVVFVLLCAFLFLPFTFATERDVRFRIHPPSYAYLDCSACLAFAEYLGRRMNHSLRFDAGGAASVLTTHRLDAANQLKRRDYAGSELRAAEVLEKVCSDALEENYVLRLDFDTRRRVYLSEKSDLPFAQYYSLQDARALKVVSKHAVRTFCQRVMGEEEEAVTRVVRELRQLSDVEWRLCAGNGTSGAPPPEGFEGGITDVCVGTEASERLEVGRIERYEKWQNTFTKRREEAIAAQKDGDDSQEPVLLEEVKDPEVHEIRLGDL